MVNKEEINYQYEMNNLENIYGQKIVVIGPIQNGMVYNTYYLKRVYMPHSKIFTGII